MLFTGLLAALSAVQADAESRLSSFTAKELLALANTRTAGVSASSEPEDNQINFYGKIITVCDFPEAECFRAEVTTGRTNFHGDGGDLANIYVPANDYDTWKQYTTSGTSADFETPSASVSSSVSLPVEGEFIYQLRNDTLSCLTVELRWMFGSAPQQQIPSSAAAVVHPRGEAKEPEFMCVGTPIAMNWDCHLDWALTTECWYNSSSSLVTAVYTVTNLGPEEVDGEGRVIVVNKKDDQPPAVTVVRKSR